MFRVSAIVLHFDFTPGIEACLRSLIGQSRPPDHVVVVDNASPEHSRAALVAAVAGLAPQASLVQAPTNGGYARGMNLGLHRAAESNAVLLLTHDCVLSPTALARLSETLESDPAIGIVGPLLTLPNNDSVFSAGGVWNRWTGRIDHVREPARADGWNEVPPRPVDWLDGACLLVRREILGTGVSELYGHYHEDVDLAARARSLGFAVICESRARASQQPGSLDPRVEAANRMLLARRWGRPGSRLRLLIGLLRHDIGTRSYRLDRARSAFRQSMRHLPKERR